MIFCLGKNVKAAHFWARARSLKKGTACSLLYIFFNLPSSEIKTGFCYQKVLANVPAFGLLSP